MRCSWYQPAAGPVPIISGFDFPASLGERGSGYKTDSGRIQDFCELKKEHLNKATLFDDPDFPCSTPSIWGNTRPKFEAKWLRPKDLCTNPKFFVEGASRFDAVQGGLGNCWMVVSVANLTLNKTLFDRVVPQDQSFGTDYAGIFHFRFWKANRWLDVVIDDRLPTVNGKLVFIRSSTENEFWSALLEKAYAKLHGSYAALIEGMGSEAMEDFTGGLTEQISIDKNRDSIWDLMTKAYHRSSLMCCSITAGRVPEEKLANGLVSGHTYSVTAMHLLNGNFPMIRLRNPWGGDMKWQGAWSDKSNCWDNVPQSEREAMGHTVQNDGEFWMSAEDFLREFNFVDICYLDPGVFDDGGSFRSSPPQWHVSVFEGAWVYGATAGGIPSCKATFWTNPQYLVKLTEPDDNDGELCTATVALMQRHRRGEIAGSKIFLIIGFVIYKLEGTKMYPVPLDRSFFSENKYVARSDSYIRAREVVTRFKLPPGSYCIVPTTYYRDEEGQFLLRIFTEKECIAKPYDEDAATVPVAAYVLPYKKCTGGPGKMEIKEDPDCVRAQQVRKAFGKVAGAEEQLSVVELQEAFKVLLSTVFPDVGSEGFSLDTCRSMLAFADHNRTGMLNLTEFCVLWSLVEKWKAVFSKYDEENTGCMNSSELRPALQCAGCTVNGNILHALIVKYGSKKGTINFEDFVRCGITLRTLIDIFQEKGDSGKAIFTMDEWLINTIYT